MIAYHVTAKVYKPGDLICQNSYSEITQVRGNVWVEEIFEQYRPEGAPSRLKSVFTFERLEQAGAYADLINLRMHYYEVEIPDNPLRSPMCLCEFIRVNRHKGEPFLKRIADEYWACTMNWNFMELITDCYKVIREVKKPGIFEKLIDQNNYKLDMSAARERFVDENSINEVDDNKN